jgi:Kef-type K+ transport system membrane component KefB
VPGTLDGPWVSANLFLRVVNMVNQTLRLPGRLPILPAAYAGMLLGALALFFLIRTFGESLVAPAPAGQAVVVGTAPSAGVDVMMHILLALVTIVVLCRATAGLFCHLNQPPVIGEIIAGILLGPSVLGRLAPDLATYLLPPTIAPVLGTIAHIGLILYMFTVGLELDLGSLRDRGHAVVAISHASIVTPFLLGAGLALEIYPRLSTRDVPFTGFALFLGMAMSVTAFPVLARILTDRRISQTPMGVMALTCAAIDDVTAWCLLAVVVGVAQSRVAGAAFVLLGAACYIALMLLVMRPLILRLARFDQHEELSHRTVSIVLIALLMSACATQTIGIHAIFGAFLLGAVIPRESAIARQLSRKLDEVVSILLLPAFFAFTGMRTQLGLLSTPGHWLICGLIIVVATLGKFGGTLAAARLAGSGWRDASALGVLMNTRGLMELIVLNIGLDLGIISLPLFTMMVMMALVTTLATTPILQFLANHWPDPCSHNNGVVLAQPLPKSPMTVV